MGSNYFYDSRFVERRPKKFMIVGAPSLFDFTSSLRVWAIQDGLKRGQFE